MQRRRLFAALLAPFVPAVALAAPPIGARFVGIAAEAERAARYASAVDALDFAEPSSPATGGFLILGPDSSLESTFDPGAGEALRLVHEQDGIRAFVWGDWGRP